MSNDDVTIDITKFEFNNEPTVYKTCIYMESMTVGIILHTMSSMITTRARDIDFMATSVAYVAITYRVAKQNLSFDK